MILPTLRTRSPLAVMRECALSLVAALTCWAALHTWTVFVVDADAFLDPLLRCALVLAGTGAAIRLLTRSLLVAIAVQSVVTVSAATLTLTGRLPGPGTVAPLRDVLDEATASAGRYAAPVAADVPSVAPLLILGGLAFLFLTDLLARTLRAPATAGLPLLAAYTIPVSGLGEEVPLTIFLVCAVGYLVMIWGSTEGEERAAGTASPVLRRRDALALGVPALALAAAAPLVIPTMQPGLMDELRERTNGSGTPDAAGNIAITNPLTDLRRDLDPDRPDIPLLRMTTDAPDPRYLKTATLDVFSGDAWRASEPQTVSRDREATDLSPPPGVTSGIPTRRYSYSFTGLIPFHSRWLPLPTPASRVEASTAWEVEQDSQDLVAAEPDLDTSGQSWSATGLDPQWTADDLRRSGEPSGSIRARYTELPGDLPDQIERYAREATQGQDTAFDRAVALQDWFTQDDRFTYTVDSGAGGGESLLGFLSPDGRRGYCEQFSAAMTVMARALGIPARVAVGFLQPEQVGPQEYLYSSRDMHAWTEIYLDGFGWVRFEPTPADRSGADAPAYTRDRTPGSPAEPSPSDPEASASAPSQDAEPSPSPSTPDDQNTPADQEADAESDGSVFGGLGSGTLVAAGLVLLGLVAAAGLAGAAGRRCRESARSGATGPAEQGWAEVIATARSVGVAVDPGRSPQQVADQVAAGFDGPAQEALDRLRKAVEDRRFSPARPAGDPEAVARDVAVCRAALEAGASPRDRRLGRVRRAVAGRRG